MSELKIEAKAENMAHVLAFVDECLEKLKCPMKIQMQIDIAVEELFINVASYAYVPDTGDVMLQIDSDGESIFVTFIDSGGRFDPLARPDPDVTLAAEKRQIGGLGIYMVKKSMDEMKYQRVDGQNILTIRKSMILPAK